MANIFNQRAGYSIILEQYMQPLEAALGKFVDSTDKNQMYGLTSEIRTVCTNNVNSKPNETEFDRLAGYGLLLDNQIPKLMNLITLSAAERLHKMEALDCLSCIGRVCTENNRTQAQVEHIAKLNAMFK